MLRTTTTAWRKEMSQRRKVWKEIHVLNISPIWPNFERDGQLIHIFTNITIPGRWLPALSRSVKRSQKSRCRRTEFRIVNWSVWECKGQWGKERIYGPIDRKEDILTRALTQAVMARTKTVLKRVSKFLLVGRMVEKQLESARQDMFAISIDIAQISPPGVNTILLYLFVFFSQVWRYFLWSILQKGSYCSKSSTCKSCPFLSLALSLTPAASEVRPALPIPGLSFLLSERTQLLLFTSYIVKM